MDESFDVSDSTDWLGTPLVSLMPVEQAFRCHVCKDFFSSPMLTSCNHTFCSLCIRRSLSVEGKCPLCRASDQESKLRGNWAMREAVDAFTTSRSAILQFARNPPPLPSPKSPKRRVEEVDGLAQEVQSKRPRMVTRLSKAKATETTASMLQDDIEVPESQSSDEYEPDDGLVSCPICLTRMKEQQVDRHLDTSCPGSPQPQGQQRSSSPGGSTNLRTFQSAFSTASTATKTPERLPTLAYSMMKESALRKKLADLGISSAGNKQVLERRHREWVMLWNANCDSAHPKKRSELLQDLEMWERTVGTRAPMMSRAANTGAQIKDKDFDGAAWAAKHESSFKDLIANARKSKRQAEQKSKEQHDNDGLGVDGKEGELQATSTRTGEADPTQLDTPSEVVDLTGSSSSWAKGSGEYAEPACRAPSVPTTLTNDNVAAGFLNSIPNVDTGSRAMP